MIKGFRGTSLIDYPGKISSVVFTYRCNFRCPYCYNIDLVIPERFCRLEELSEELIIEELKKRKNFIKGVVITGGEPTVWGKTLLDFIYKIKLETDLCVKVDTNGSHPKMIKTLLEEKLVDYVAIDFKTSPAKYQNLGGDFNLIKKTLDLSKEYPEKVEIRITLYPPLITQEDLRDMIPFLKAFKRVALQKFVSTQTLAKYLGLNKEETDPSTEYYQMIFDFLRDNLKGIELIKRF